MGDLVGVHGGHPLLAGERDPLCPRWVGLQPTDHLGDLLDRLNGDVVDIR